VVVGLSYNEPYCAYVLDEYQSADYCELFEECCEMHLQRRLQYWVGDCESETFQQTYNLVSNDYRDANDNYRGFWPVPSQINDMETPYPYVLSLIRKHLRNGSLFLKDAHVREDLLSIDPSDLQELQVGDYPSIEALGMAVDMAFQIHEGIHAPKLERYSPPNEWCL
jgi:hypothetical protein